MHTINRNPTECDLRVFGVLLACFSCVVVTIAWWRFESPRWAFCIGSVASVLVLVYAAIPSLRRRVYVGWMTAVYPIGVVSSLLLLAMLYYAILTPIGWLRRTLLGDPLTRDWDSDVESYWSEREVVNDPERYYRQY